MFITRILPAFALVAATATAAPAAPRVATADTPDSALHGYVLGRFAADDDELARAARYFDAARASDPGRPALTRRAFDLAVASGDQARAANLARELAAAGRIDSDIALVRLSDAILRKDWNAATMARTGIASAGYAVVVGPIVDAWILFGGGNHKAALAKIDPSAFSGFARSYIAETRAHMLAADGQWAAAATAYSELYAGTGNGISFLRAGEADARAGNGDRAGALALLSGNDVTVVAARQRLEQGKRIGALAPDPRRAIGWMMSRLATDLSRDKPVPLALLFARVGTFLAPDVPATWMICGDVLARSGQRESSLLAYARVPATDALAEAASARMTEVLQLLGRDRDAGTVLLAATAAPTAEATDWTRLADWHRRNDRFGDAAAAYTRAITLAGTDAAWSLYFLRGSMNERGGNWAAAEPDLRLALAKSSGDPIVLNYLGYSLLDRGLNTAEAVGFIQRAAMLRPGDGGVIDSLGWSQYRQGNYSDAVATLERAAALESTDPTVTDHLGDAYWRVGRLIEARFRWRAARDLDPDEKLKRALTAKLDFGLDAALAMAETAPQ